MIRVLHIFNIMNRGGAETMIMNIYRNLDRDRIQFDFLCMSSGQGDYDKEITDMGGKIYRIEPPNKVGYLQHIKDIKRVCKSNNYKVVHIPTYFHSGIVCLAAFLAGVPIRIVHSHTTNIIKKSKKRILYEGVCRILIKIFATDKIACGEMARDSLFGKSKKEEKEVLILKNGIDIDSYSNVNKEQVIEQKRKFNIKMDELVVGHVGRFEEVKNQTFLLKIAKIYKENNEKIKFLLVGDGSKRKEVEKEVKDAGLEDYFIFAGKQENIPLIMNIIDVFVMPSLYEGFPMVVIEALAAGRKCVLSDTISKEVDIIPNSMQFLNLNDDVMKWAKVIKEEMADKIDCEVAKNILIDKGFDVKNTTKVLEKIYMR